MLAAIECAAQFRVSSGGVWSRTFEGCSFERLAGIASVSSAFEDARVVLAVRDELFTDVDLLPGGFWFAACFFLDGPHVDMTPPTVPTHCHSGLAWSEHAIIGMDRKARANVHFPPEGKRTLPIRAGQPR